MVGVELYKIIYVTYGLFEVTHKVWNISRYCKICRQLDAYMKWSKESQALSSGWLNDCHQGLPMLGHFIGIAIYYWTMYQNIYYWIHLRLRTLMDLHNLARKTSILNLQRQLILVITYQFFFSVLLKWPNEETKHKEKGKTLVLLFLSSVSSCAATLLHMVFYWFMIWFIVLKKI